MRPALCGLAALIVLCAASGARAGERYGVIGGDGYPSGYGFAGEAIGGDYIGAPLTRISRPSDLVPPAWGYGTYGVPTVTGIRQAPTAAPTLTVINAEGPAVRRRGSSQRPMSSGATGFAPGAGDVRVISVTVPRR